MKPKLLDTYCCAGGAARGYADAGFDVYGVDIDPQPTGVRRNDLFAYCADLLVRSGDPKLEHVGRQLITHLAANELEAVA